MIGLLVTGDGIPIAHRVFDGNTKDATTMPEVMADLQASGSVTVVDVFVLDGRYRPLLRARRAGTARQWRWTLLHQCPQEGAVSSSSSTSATRRALISENNLADVAAAGFDHVIATRLHCDADVAAVLATAAEPDTVWVPAGGERTACDIDLDGSRHVVVDSPARHRRDDHRREELLERTEGRVTHRTLLRLVRSHHQKAPRIQLRRRAPPHDE